MLPDLLKNELLNLASRTSALSQLLFPPETSLVTSLSVLSLSAYLCFLFLLLCVKPFRRRKFPRGSTPGDESKGKDMPLGSGKRVLLVTAHPDDECMFFGPAIVELVDAGAQVFILCFSTGNYQSSCGKTRRKELLKSCSILKIPSENVTSLNFSNLPDDPDVKWNESTIAALVLRYVETYQCDAVITFDRGGGSGHPNHRALFCGVQLLIFTRMMPSYCKFLSLKTVKTSVKYIPWIEVPLSYFQARVACIASLRQRYRIQRAMAAHSSQMVWFRHLYIVFSRYLYLNTFQAIDGSERRAAPSTVASSGGSNNSSRDQKAGDQPAPAGSKSTTTVRSRSVKVNDVCDDVVKTRTRDSAKADGEVVGKVRPRAVPVNS